jgi:hypothetical protein
MEPDMERLLDEMIECFNNGSLGPWLAPLEPETREVGVRHATSQLLTFVVTTVPRQAAGDAGVFRLRTVALGGAADGGVQAHPSANVRGSAALRTGLVAGSGEDPHPNPLPEYRDRE